MIDQQITTPKIMHIDYDSFFASVEQQANPALRNKPIVVTAGKGNHGIVCAASIQAKKLGIKTGMPIFKVRKMFPDIQIQRGDFTKYSYVHKKSFEIFNKYTDLVEPFSIDEAFLDVTATEPQFGSAENIAYLIKKDISESFGSYITCSIGIGPNKLLAKLVSDFNKPNGLFIVTEDNLSEILENIKLTDFCGIGRRLEKKLNAMGITTVKQLQDTPIHVLYTNFGNVTGSFLKNSSRGIGYGKIHKSEHKRRPKSISHQHTLYNGTNDPKIIRANLFRLSEMVVKRLRQHELLCRRIEIILRDSEYKYYQEHILLGMSSDSFSEIEHHIKELFQKMEFKEKCQFVSVIVSKLEDKNFRTLPLFNDNQKKKRLNKIMDDVNGRFGDFTIFTANTLLADSTKTKISSFLKH